MIICNVNFVGIVAYYDIRKLPVSTIRHKNCEVLLSLPGYCHCCDGYRYIIVRDFSNIFFAEKLCIQWQVVKVIGHLQPQVCQAISIIGIFLHLKRTPD